MSTELLILLAEYGALRFGCEKALELLEDPNASAFDTDKVIRILKTILEN